MDVDLVSAINYWDRNKEAHASNVQKMADARAAKKLAASGGVAAPTGTQTVAQTGTQSVTQPSTSAAAFATAEASQASVLTGEKKKSDWVWWGIAGFVAVVTLGAVMMTKED